MMIAALPTHDLELPNRLAFRKGVNRNPHT